MDPSISSLVALAASSDLEARSRTSSATTAKPLPAEPARAASTAAFSARILVWNAMFSMEAMILEISWEELEIFSMAVFSSFMCSTLVPKCPPAWPTKRPASSAAAAVILALEEISLMVAASSSTELACSTEPWLSRCAPLETWSLAEDTWPAEASIWRMVPLSSTFRVRMERRIPWNSPT